MVETRDNIVKYLKGSGWDIELYHYWQSEQFLYVLEQLKELSDDGKHFVPKLKNVFAWMKLCPFDKIKVLMLVDDWGYTLNRQGVPYSCDMTKMAKEEFRPDVKICNRHDIKEFVKPLIAEHGVFDYNLERWCKQGVLMIPLSPTCRLEGKPHYRIWSQFINRVIEAVNGTYKDLPAMLTEKATWSYEDQIESKYTILYTGYPKCSDENWPGKLNKVLSDRNEKVIKW